jgi:hypothetical protein
MNMLKIFINHLPATVENGFRITKSPKSFWGQMNLTWFGLLTVVKPFHMACLRIFLVKMNSLTNSTSTCVILTPKGLNVRTADKPVLVSVT